MTDSDVDVLLAAIGRKVYETAFNLIQGDPHQWSDRGCQTCRAITTIIGKPFGCILYAEKKREQRKTEGNSIVKE